MVRTGNVDFSCKRLTSIEIRKSKYHIIRRVRFRWETPPPPPRKISGSALGLIWEKVEPGPVYLGSVVESKINSI